MWWKKKKTIIFNSLQQSLFTTTTTTTTKAPTGILLMNLGGPSSLDKVHPFLQRLFGDGDLIPLPFQDVLSRFIAWRRTPKIRDQYEAIGGGSPILYWTQEQGKRLVERLDRVCPATAPHKFYIGFRYAEPLTQEAVSEMLEDGVTRAVAFSQYPQYSCSTTGSSLNELHRVCKALDAKEQIKWNVIDRWGTHAKLIAAYVKLIEDDIAANWPTGDPPVLLFSAHSLPMSVVNRGDPYPHEVAATVSEIMKGLSRQYPYRIVWQSRVGPSAWLGPQTDEAIKGLAGNGHRNMLIIPVAFTSDHIETLYELDLEYVKHAQEEMGLKGVKRLAALNIQPLFIDTLTELVASCLEDPKANSLAHMALRCPQCTNNKCGETKSFFLRHHHHEDHLGSQEKKMKLLKREEKEVRRV